MKILHITASYKPAYIYGGPIYSVAALCEALGKDSSAPLPAMQVLRMADSSTTLKNNEREKDEIQDDKDSSTLLSIPSASTELSISVDVLTTLANGKEELFYLSGEKREVEGVTVRYFKRLTKDHSHFSPALLWWLWKNAKQYDVVHIHSWWNLVSMGSVLVCLLKGIKPIVSPRGMLGDYTFTKGKKLFHQLIGRHLLRKCDFHATTMMEAEEIKKSLSFDSAQDDSKIIDLMDGRAESKKWKVERTEIKEQRAKSKDKELQSIFVIHNMVKLPEILPVKTRAFDGVLKLIFLSRIHHKKGIELLMDALAEVPFAFNLSIVGEGENTYVKSLKRKAESLKLSDRIVWMGPVYGEEKYKLLAEHDLFVLPSFNENFANVVIESIAVKTPVLVSDKVGLASYILQNKCGLVHQLNKNSLGEELNYFYNSNKNIYPPATLLMPTTNKYLQMYGA